MPGRRATRSPVTGVGGVGVPARLAIGVERRRRTVAIRRQFGNVGHEVKTRNDSFVQIGMCSDAGVDDRNRHPGTGGRIVGRGHLLRTLSYPDAVRIPQAPLIHVPRIIGACDGGVGLLGRSEQELVGLGPRDSGIGGQRICNLPSLVERHRLAQAHQSNIGVQRSIDGQVDVVDPRLAGDLVADGSRLTLL